MNPNTLKKILKFAKDPWFILGAAVPIGMIAVMDAVAVLLRPAVSVVHTYHNQKTGEEFYHGHTEMLCTKRDIDKPAKTKITIERRHYD